MDDFLLNLFVQVFKPKQVKLRPVPIEQPVAPTPLPTPPTTPFTATPSPLTPQLTTPETPVVASEPTPLSETGVVFKNIFQPEAGALNTGAVVQQRITSETTVRENGVEYVNGCRNDQRAEGYAHVSGSGTTVESSRSVTPYVTGRAEARSWFTSAKTPPAPGLRVIVRNASATQSIDPMPYTNREYDQGRRSESFVVSLGEAHNSKFLAVKLGENQLTYQIKRGDQIVESGEFVANIGIEFQNMAQTTTIPRRKEHLRCKPKDDHHQHKRDRH